MISQELQDRSRRAHRIVSLGFAVLFLLASADAAPGKRNRGKCLEREKQLVTVQKCAHLVNPGGHCSHYTMTTAEQNVCIRWERDPNDDTRERLAAARQANAEWAANDRNMRWDPARLYPDWIDQHRGRFSLEVLEEEGIVLQEGVYSADQAAAGLSVECEFPVQRGDKDVAGTCRSRIPVSGCGGGKKLCWVETDVVLRSGIDWRAADYFQVGWSAPKAYVILEGLPLVPEDLRCDCLVSEAQSVASVALPMREIPDDLDCEGPDECYQMGNDPSRASESRIRHWEAGCFAGSPDACAALGSALSSDPSSTQPAAYALARACWQGKPETCGLVGRLFEEGKVLETKSLRSQLDSANTWYKKACDEGLSSACTRHDALKSLQDRWSREWIQSGKLRKFKQQEKCKDGLGEWLMTAWRAL